MSRYDYIILYEHRARELENAVFLAMLLEKKGYKVAIEYRRSARLLFQKTDVLLVPFFWDNENVIDFTMQPFCKIKKVINMQYEQVFTRTDETTGRLYPHEVAVNAQHIAWGEREKELMIKNGISEKNIHQIGHISMDFNHKKFDKYFHSRKFMSKKYGIPLDKKWHLFISSFSFVGLTDDELKQMSVGLSDPDSLMTVAVKSQTCILDWYEQYLKENRDTIVIYRPHPGEIKSERLEIMQKKYKNFVCISDYSIRQWIRISDSICTWQSTSIVDAYYAGKSCAIIRPVKIPEENEFGIYGNQRFIVDYDEFENFINNQTDYEIADEIIKKYYCNSFDADAFKKMVDLCIKVRNSNKYSYNYMKQKKQMHDTFIKYPIFRVLTGIASLVDYSKVSPSKYTYDVKHSRIESKNIKKEIMAYRKRLKSLVDKY